MSFIRPRDQVQRRGTKDLPLFRLSEAQLQAQLRRACAIGVDGAGSKRAAPSSRGGLPGPSRQRTDDEVVEGSRLDAEENEEEDLFELR